MVSTAEAQSRWRFFTLVTPRSPLRADLLLRLLPLFMESFMQLLMEIITSPGTLLCSSPRRSEHRRKTSNQQCMNHPPVVLFSAKPSASSKTVKLDTKPAKPTTPSSTPPGFSSGEGYSPRRGWLSRAGTKQKPALSPTHNSVRRSPCEISSLVQTPTAVVTGDVEPKISLLVTRPWQNAFERRLPCPACLAWPPNTLCVFRCF